jgi:putative FmdB family regulatory protein
MPLYEYRCESCGEQEEKLEGFSAPKEHDCEKCGKTKGMKRQISQSGFTLAGGGWFGQGYSGPSHESKETPAAPKGGCSGGCCCH